MIKIIMFLVIINWWPNILSLHSQDTSLPRSSYFIPPVHQQTYNNHNEEKYFGHLDIHLKSLEGDSALETELRKAIWEGNLADAQILFKRGVRLSSHNSSLLEDLVLNYSTWQAACQRHLQSQNIPNCHTDPVQTFFNLFFRFNPDIFIQKNSKTGNTPTHIAVCIKNYKVATLLLPFLASTEGINLCNKQHQNILNILAWQLAGSEKNSLSFQQINRLKQLLKITQDLKGDPHLRDSQGNSAQNYLNLYNQSSSDRQKK